MGHVDMFWVYFILYFAYIVSDGDCHVVYDLVRKLCELEGWRMEEVRVLPASHGHFVDRVPTLSRLHDEFHLGVSHLQKGNNPIF